MPTSDKKKNNTTTRKVKVQKTTPPPPPEKKTSRALNENGLTYKQEMFCRYYLDCGGNASEAYRMAYDTSNMQDDTINKRASELKNNGAITGRLEELMSERHKATEVNRAKVESVLMDIINSSVEDLYYSNPANGNVKMKKPHQLPKRVKRALGRMKLMKDGADYVFQDKVSAAKTLGKWNGWESPIKNEHTLNGENVIQFGAFPPPPQDNGDDKD